MPPRQPHVDRAAQNEGFFLSLPLATTPYLDWAVVSLYYAALHWLEAFLADYNAPIGTHQPNPNGGGHHPRRRGERTRAISHVAALSPIFASYQELHDRAEDARYNLLPFTDTHVQTLYQTEYLTVRNHIQPLL